MLNSGGSLGAGRGGAIVCIISGMWIGASESFGLDYLVLYRID